MIQVVCQKICSNVLFAFCFFPKEKEQTKIGNTFQKLDSLINQHQQKHDKLLNVKKALLEKMFPKKGADVPEIRFKGFDTTWEEKTLGELLTITSASRVHKNEWTASGVPFFRSSDVVSDYKGEPNKKAFISFEKLNGSFNTFAHERLLNKSRCSLKLLLARETQKARVHKHLSVTSAISDWNLLGAHVTKTPPTAL